MKVSTAASLSCARSDHATVRRGIGRAKVAKNRDYFARRRVVRQEFAPTPYVPPSQEPVGRPILGSFRKASVAAARVASIVRTVHFESVPSRH
jgi:hypothetical protein